MENGVLFLLRTLKRIFVLSVKSAIENCYYFCDPEIRQACLNYYDALSDLTFSCSQVFVDGSDNDSKEFLKLADNTLDCLNAYLAIAREKLGVKEYVV